MRYKEQAFMLYSEMSQLRNIPFNIHETTNTSDDNERTSAGGSR